MMTNNDESALSAIFKQMEEQYRRDAESFSGDMAKEFAKVRADVWKCANEKLHEYAGGGASNMNSNGAYVCKHGGAVWMQRQLVAAARMKKKTPVVMSEHGKRVADFLGELFRGIYHLDHKALHRVDWANESYILFVLGWRTLATHDYNELTRLVFLAHEMGLRVEINASRAHYLHLKFLQTESHPTFDEAVAQFRSEWGW